MEGEKRAGAVPGSNRVTELSSLRLQHMPLLMKKAGTQPNTAKKYRKDVLPG